MLQQTQVPRVVPRYSAWLERWPTVGALAAATPADVIRAWQGLGYNRRAVNLHRAARHVAEHGWPGRPHRAARRRPLHRRRRRRVRVRQARSARGRQHPPRPGAQGAPFDHECAQALFDLGATVCLARIPRCDACPLAAQCPVPGHARRAARRQGPLEGSFRQRRAGTLRLVAAGARPLTELDGAAVESLARDGLVVIDDEFVALPGA